MKRMIMKVFVGLALVGCAIGQSGNQSVRNRDQQMVVGKTWQWVSTITPAERITVANPARYTILLRPDGKAQVRFDCNRGGGDFKITEGHLSFGPLISTRMACPPDSLNAPFMRDLQRVVSFYIEGDFLYLELPYDSGTMKFQPVP